MQNKRMLQVVLASLCLLSAAAQAQSKLSITNLDFLSQQGQAKWLGLNNAGTIVGTIDGKLSEYRNGALATYTLDRLGQNVLVGNSGAIVYQQYGETTYDADRLYILQNGARQAIPSLSSTPRGRAEATAINDSGVIVGESMNADGKYRPFLYKDGHTYNLGTLGGGDYARATDINNQGVVVGTSKIASSEGYDNVFVYANGVMGSLGLSSVRPVQINDASQIVGTQWGFPPDMGTPAYEVWLYDQGKVTSVGLAGEENFAVDLNNAGQIIGTTGWRDHFWLYSDGKTIDLNTLLYEDGWTVTSVIDLNDQGQILATATRAGRGESYVLLTPDLAPVLLPPAMPPALPALPVPEPGTYAMLIGGLGVLAVWRRRRAA